MFSEEVGEVDYTPTRSTRTGPDPTDVPPAVDMLLNADRPVIYAGQGVHYAKAWEPLRDLAELVEAPVATSLNGKSAFPEDHPLSLGAGSKSEPGQLARFLDECDLLFGVGTSFSTSAYGITVPEDNEIVHATLDPADVDKEVDSDHAIVGDAKLTLEALVEEAEGRLDGPRGRREDVEAAIQSAKEAWLEEWRPKLESDETPINPYRVIHELTEVVDASEAIVTHDAGNARDFIAPFWESPEPLGYIGWGKTTQLGYGLGLAMGAKLAHPDKTCINVWGDGAIGMTGLDIETAVRYDVPILSILLNNFEMAGYETPFGGDFRTVAEGLGAYSERIEDPGEVAAAIERGVEKTEEGTPVLLEFITSKETELSRPDLE
jgi:acetolactate synthase-1/2/3 large subunit